MENDYSLCDLYAETVNNYSCRNEWEDENWRSRFNEWPGRSPDGKKHGDRIGAKPFPWENASDSAPPIVDAYIREDIDMCMEALSGAQIEAHAIEVRDVVASSKATTILKWLTNTQMKGLEKEQELALNYWLEGGKVAVVTTWQREISVAPQAFDLEDFKAVTVGQDAAGNPVSAFAVLMDPTQEEEAVEIAQRLYAAEAMERIGEPMAELKKSIAKRAIRELREKSQTYIPMPYVSKNRPCVSAYRYGYDFFRTNHSLHIQEDTAVFCREFLTEEKLKNGVMAYGWSQEWVDAVLARGKGQSSVQDYQYQPGSKKTYININGSNNFPQKDTYEIVYAYHKKTDEDGVVTIWHTVFSPHVKNQDGKEFYAIEEPLNYQHGQIPACDSQLEVTTRRVEDSRGYGEALSSAQRQIKAEWDSRIDRASITTLPPLTYPHGREPVAFGPGQRFPKMRADDYKFVEVPQYDRVSETIEVAAYRGMNKWLGRADETSDPVYSSLRKRRLTKKWLGLWREVFAQCFALCQQFMDEEVYVRVVGEPSTSSGKISRDEIQGEYDIFITFNALSFDTEIRKQNLEYLQRIIEMDVAGVIDRAAAVTLGLNIIDPQMSALIVRPQESVTDSEITETKNSLARIYAGIEENVKPGQNYDLRKKVLGDLVFGQDKDGNPKNPAALKRLEQDGKFKENLEKLFKQYDFQMEQRENAQIGRLGA